MSKQDEFITLADFALLTGIDRCALDSAKASKKTAFPRPVKEAKQGFAKLYRKAELLAWNNARSKKNDPKLDNQLAQDFLRTPPHCGVNLRG